jgi:enoyl-CoA hydratase/carnithine racemase
MKPEWASTWRCPYNPYMSVPNDPSAPATAAATAHDAALLIERRGKTLLLTISNPAFRNALAPSMYQAGKAALADAALDDSIAAVVITGGLIDGKGVFCGGGNLNRLRENQSKPREVQYESIGHLHRWVEAIRACPKPVIAAVEGPAAGAGFSIALACDMIIAAEDAKFVMAYVKSGLTPDGGGSYALSTMLPRQLAFELMALGDTVAAPRLHQLGVVSQIVPAGAAEDAALNAAERFGKSARGAVSRVKQLSWHAQTTTLTEQLELERGFFVESLHGAEAREGIGAFLEKRTPTFP